MTVRGDWKKPEPGSPVEGTVLMAYTGRGKGPNAESFIDMELGAGIMDAAIWYPEQTPDDITEYSPTVKMGVNGYFGNEYNNVKNVTFVNCWRAVHFSYTNGGASPVVNGCYGTPLYTAPPLRCRSSRRSTPSVSVRNRQSIRFDRAADGHGGRGNNRNHTGDGSMNCLLFFHTVFLL